MRQVTPGANQDGSCRERYPLVPHKDQQRQDHATACGIARQYDRAWILDSEEVQIRRQTVLKSAREGELWRQSVVRREHPRLQLARVSLQLVPVHVHTSKEIRSSVDIEHNLLPGVVVLFPLVVVRAHLNPFGVEGTGVRLSPLPPLASTDLPYALRAELGFEDTRGVLELVGRDGHLVDLDPLGMRNPLRGEGLDLLDRVMRDILEERPDQVESLIVGQVRGRPLVERFAVEVLRGDEYVSSSGVSTAMFVCPSVGLV